jgi:hypothetical protein
MRAAIAALVFLGGVLPLGLDNAFSGECGEGEDTYLATFEAGPWSDPSGFQESGNCLGGSWRLVDGPLWAGPIAAQRFAARRGDPRRARIASAVSALMNTAWADSADHRSWLLRIAAGRGIARIDSTDVFGDLFGGASVFYLGAYQDMAILQDCRAVGVLSARFEQLRGKPEAGYSDEVLDLLNCLYHIPCAQAKALATELLSREKDSRLRGRLQRVLNREDPANKPLQPPPAPGE